MRRFALAIFFAVFVCCTPQLTAQQSPPSSASQPQQNTSAAPSAITLPTGTQVILALASPVWARTAQPGDILHAQTAFPVVFNDQIAIPVGTYVEGQIDAVVRPTWKTHRAEFQIHFTKFIFVNGYVVLLQPSSDQALSPQNQATLPPTPADIAAAFANVSVQVTPSNDILLDNGSQIEMLLQAPLPLDARSVADATHRSKALSPAQFRTASLCRPTPGAPGTSDTVIPGSPGTPGTPPIVIPQGPGMPDIVIPGTPGTPATDPIIIPGSPGTPGISCPGPPMVSSSLALQGDHTQSFRLDSAVQIAGQQLIPGTYQITWKGLGPAVQASILQNKKRVASIQARIVGLIAISTASTPAVVSGPDGSLSLRSLRFAGQSFALYFDQGAVPQILPSAPTAHVSTQ